MARKFQKLDIDLPKQPLSDQRIWMVAGWLLALVIIVFTLYAYLDYRNDDGSFQPSNEQIYKTR
jgi:hypothetical protein